MGFTKYTSQAEKTRARMNEGIRAPEVRVIGPEGENFGILAISAAIAKAQELGLDLIEISPNAQPPVCKITDYGKFKYEQKKKDKEIKSKAHVTETKVTQVKIGTSERDMQIKAGKAAAWLKEGHRVRVDLFLWGRYKYMEFGFLKERLERFLAVIPEGYKIAEPIQKGLKGLSVSIERDPSKKTSAPKAPKTPDPVAPAEDHA
ncbi:translation initiation factor IF-3 [Candidatus Kaiserbacteria bacterium RIFCSPLOWO2_12_FULL_53_8]|uniref:Translation initiation factor IF-3 n=2 Tax=Candidatus Kaiseribacteriota TaxID=1752734 RepID=A0A1F6CYK2_9BACT|nr:MAG: translation initiation factor IF-3 [Candidatus Kaiserbacteria bacterium RIFCSPHIGHO2_01_FULL_53_29]OGG92261.1 MAG: translation initiation factor IF-3 [Candidatus Kaiserbacteria bacterium RIFCSPLOWO2_12_FULL_53_8]